LFCFILSGCTEGESQQIGDVEAVVFTDRSDPVLEYTYVIGNKGTFAQVCVFPGYSDRKFFFRPALAGEVLEEMPKWRQQAGEIKPPFVPGGPWFFRITVPRASSQPEKEDYFKDTNADLRKWLAGLRSQVVHDEYRIDAPPDWVTSDGRIMNRLVLETPIIHGRVQWR